MEGVAGVVHTPSQISSSLARSRTRPEAARYAWPAPAPARGELHTGPLNRALIRRLRGTAGVAGYAEVMLRAGRPGRGSQPASSAWVG